MSKYTTGEMAKQCGVSVRTVQYYDSRNILVPSELSEGGRRLYSEEDLQKLKIICFLRNIGLSINGIGELFTEENPGEVILLLLDQQEQVLRNEIGERQTMLDSVEELKRQLKRVEHFSVESIGDMAYYMENKKKLYKVRGIMLGVGVVMDLVEIGTLILGITEGIWWPFAVGMAVVIALTVWLFRYYYDNTAYICPKCHTVFRPKIRDVFWARHTSTARKLTCTQCGHKGFCVETYGRESGE
ncbi:MAG: MerR family transcriptional regulator [Lachnospiraceae bacterium]|nr:MerR family transcriptional regulator [Lachnospiraceae bacterium]